MSPPQYSNDQMCNRSTGSQFGIREGYTIPFAVKSENSGGERKSLFIRHNHHITDRGNGQKLNKISLLFILLFLIYDLTPGSAVVFCPDDRFLMPMSNSLPWGAVGYMDNGCTATLIDSRHIVAAAHCFCYDDTGSWQNNLFFYPNFNPNRTNTQSFAIDRAVVGTRVETEANFRHRIGG